MPRRHRLAIQHSPTDIDGRDLRLGDWVRVIAAPLSIQGMPTETLLAFSHAIGSTFQIEAFEATGCLELDLSANGTLETIWIEPYCVRQSRPQEALQGISRNPR